MCNYDSPSKNSDFIEVFDIALHHKVNKFLVTGYYIPDSAKAKKWIDWRNNCLVFEEEGKVVGFLVFADYSGKKFHILELVVLATHPDYWRRGIAKSLLSLPISKYKNKIKIESSVVEDNEKALKFYLSLGFEVEGERQKSFSRKGTFINEKLIAYYLKD
ncbi:MAG: GNAT family N-acetyltransferase [Candidatus Diapherotrites archaeon]|nr:GNAT family N-acetyltransferase [Candidatus Diapherotrites archaeon]